jgi:hypothetical protein
MANLVTVVCIAVGLLAYAAALDTLCIIMMISASMTYGLGELEKIK